MRYLISIGLLILLAGELFLFVKIISKYRKRFVPLTTLLAIFAINFGLCYALLFVPAPEVVKPPQVQITLPQQPVSPK